MVLKHHGNARYFLDGNRPLWYMLPWNSAPTVMHGIVWMVIGHSGTFYCGIQPPRQRMVYIGLLPRACGVAMPVLCVCVCVFSPHSFWTSSSLDVPAEVTQEEGHTGFLIHLLSAVRALIFLARRIQPFLSLVDCEVDFLVLTI